MELNISDAENGINTENNPAWEFYNIARFAPTPQILNRLQTIVPEFKDLSNDEISKLLETGGAENTKYDDYIYGLYRKQQLRDLSQIKDVISFSLDDFRTTDTDFNR